MAIELSCNDYAWPSLSHEAVLSVIADLGFPAVDIGVFADATHVTLTSVRANPRDRADGILRSTESAGLRVADVFLTSSMNLNHLSPTSMSPSVAAEFREIFHAVIQFAAAVGAPGVTLLPGVVQSGEPVAKAIAKSAAGLAPLVEMGAEKGLAVSVEPHVGSCIESPDATAALMAECPGLSITLDPGHFAYQGWDADSMRQLAPRTRHVQLRPGGPGVMQCRVPDNQIDFRQIISDLVSAGYEGFLASEFVWMDKWDCDRVDNTAESARLARLLGEILKEYGQ